LAAFPEAVEVIGFANVVVAELLQEHVSLKKAPSLKYCGEL